MLEQRVSQVDFLFYLLREESPCDCREKLLAEHKWRPKGRGRTPADQNERSEFRKYLMNPEGSEVNL